MISRFLNFKDTALDYSIVDFAAHLNKGADFDTMKAAVKLKNDHYATRCNENGMEFMPFIMNSMGAFDPTALKAIQKISVPWAERNLMADRIAAPGTLKGVAMKELTQQLSVVLVKCQAHSVMKRIGKGEDIEVDEGVLQGG